MRWSKFCISYPTWNREVKMKLIMLEWV